MESASAAAALGEQGEAGVVGCDRCPPQAGGRRPPSSGDAAVKLRVATLNVQTIAGRVSGVLNLLLACNVDVACLQEVRITPASFPGAVAACRRRGCEAYLSETHLDDQQRVTGGCLALSR